MRSLRRCGPLILVTVCRGNSVVHSAPRPSPASDTVSAGGFTVYALDTHVNCGPASAGSTGDQGSVGELRTSISHSPDHSSSSDSPRLTSTQPDWWWAVAPLVSASVRPVETSPRGESSWDATCRGVPGAAIAMNGCTSTPTVAFDAWVLVVAKLWPPSPRVPDICSARS